MQTRSVAYFAIPAVLAIAPGHAFAAGASCESLAAFVIPNAKIDMARTVPAGDFALPAQDQQRAQTLKSLPAFCRVTATLRPTPDSDIKVEIWLPGAGWNGKLQAVGNGGWAGTISYAAMADALRAGYATASTDTGHTVPNGSFVPGHPEKLIDFGYRSEHEMTLTAKALVTALYGTGASYSFWNGCSTGGRQGLMEATRYPDDYDGIIAGDPANPRARLNTWQLSLAKRIHSDKASYIPREKYAAIHRAVIAQCDELDGLKDGLIENPRACHFDPAAIACKGEDNNSCLTQPQVEMARAILGAGKYSDGQEYWPGFEPGSELGWALHAGLEPATAGLDHFRYVVKQDPNWDFMTLNPDKDVALAQKEDNGTVDVTKTDLSNFTRHGGKLIMFHGWADNQVSPMATVNYYKDAVAQTRNGADSVRLFMVPGMGHCRGGEGPNQFDMAAALDQWVSKGVAPAQVVATHSTAGKADRTRPLCPYPQTAHYTGSGSIDAAENFVCRAP